MDCPPFLCHRSRRLLRVGNRLLCTGSGTPVAWDGLGPPPDDQPRVITETGVIEEQPKRPAKPVARPNGGGTAASAIKPHSDEWWAQKEAEDRDAEKALARKLIICRGCSSASTKEDAATGSVPR